MRVQALGNHVITKQLVAPTKSQGGLYLVRQETRDGEHEVVSVGRDVKGDIKSGQIVLINKGNGEFWERDEVYYTRVTEDLILAIGKDI